MLKKPPGTPPLHQRSSSVTFQEVMAEHYHIFVEEGGSIGEKITIPEGGARLGRSSKNDISLLDPLLSRHHCRIFFKDGGLWVTDLGSANETLLNGVRIDESPVYRGNRITIGDTVLKVVDDGRPQTTAETTANHIDLGLSPASTLKSGSHAKKIGFGPLLTILFIVTAVGIAGFILKNINSSPSQDTAITIKAPKEDTTLTVDYEKVEASAENIFYYHLSITPKGVLSITIDDLENNRSVREEKKVDPELIKDLTEFLNQSGFMELRSTYEGVNPKIMEQRSIAITIGNHAGHTTVLNRVEPDVFTVVREKLEDFGQVELGIWAIQFSTEKLTEMSNDAYLLGKKLYAERLIALGNLSAAIKSFKEAEWYLETVEEKPDFYSDILASRRVCLDELKQSYEEHNFQTERAIRLRDWNAAAEELKILLELIPDREDQRNKEARKKLIEVDARTGIR